MSLSHFIVDSLSNPQIKNIISYVDGDWFTIHDVNAFSQLWSVNKKGTSVSWDTIRRDIGKEVKRGLMTRRSKKGTTFRFNDTLARGTTSTTPCAQHKVTVKPSSSTDAQLRELTSKVDTMMSMMVQMSGDLRSAIQELKSVKNTPVVTLNLSDIGALQNIPDINTLQNIPDIRQEQNIPNIIESDTMLELQNNDVTDADNFFNQFFN